MTCACSRMVAAMSGHEVESLEINRGRTAMRRHTCSRPVALALAGGIVSNTTTVLDYGCGRGGDLRYLTKRGIDAVGWDPAHRTDGERRTSDVVNLGYVLNVIESPEERSQVLRAALALAKEALVVSVRVDKGSDAFEEYGDGCVTARNTFQKLYSQAEFREYVEEVTGLRPHIAGLGIAYLFKDAAREAAYIASQAFTRRLEYRTDLIEQFTRHPLAKRFVRKAHELGRIPHPDEFKQYPGLLEAFGSAQRIERLLLRTVNPEKFQGTQEQRKEDILLFLAMLPLQRVKPPAMALLPQDIQRDIRAIWKSHVAALADAKTFLFSMGKEHVIRDACRASTVGKLLPTDLYVHTSAVDELPPVLRLLLFAVRQVVGDVEHDLVKVSLDGKSVSLLAYPGFDEDAHPALVQSIRVDLGRAQYQVRRYATSENPAILHRKDAFVTREYPLFEQFRSLSEAEARAGLLTRPDIGRRQQWEAALAEKGLWVNNHSLVVSPSS